MLTPARNCQPHSFLMGGFECTTHMLAGGRRVDVARQTLHDVFAYSDYRLAMSHGLRTLRDGASWYRIEQQPGCYDWRGLRVLLDASRKAGAHVIWDLLHFGWPQWTDPFSADFSSRFAEFAYRVAGMAGPGGWFVPINEISFLSWIGGEVGHFAPHAQGRGDDLKRALCKAAISAIKAIRAVDPQAVIMLSEPLIHVHDDEENTAAAADHNEAQFEAADTLLGRSMPELGGDPDLIDLVGCNYYPHNQWRAGSESTPLSRAEHRPLSSLLHAAASRLGKPLVLTETGAEGPIRGEWFAHVCSEVRAAQRGGVDIRGICLYPLLNHLGWDDDRYCAHGLFCGMDPVGRQVYAPLAREIDRQATRFGILAPSSLAARSL